MEKISTQLMNVALNEWPSPNWANFKDQRLFKYNEFITSYKISDYKAIRMNVFAAKGLTYENIPPKLKTDIGSTEYNDFLANYTKNNSKKTDQNTSSSSSSSKNTGKGKDKTEVEEIVEESIPLKSKISRDASRFVKQDDGSFATPSGSTTPNSNVGKVLMDSVGSKLNIEGKSVIRTVLAELGIPDTDYADVPIGFLKQPGVELKLTASELSSYINLFSYTGLNPRVIYIKLCQLAKMAGLSEEEFLRDMAGILIFYLTRGTRIYSSKVLNKTGKTGRMILSDLANRYKIVKNSPTKADDITIARIAAVFALQLNQLMAYEFVRVVGTIPADFHRSLCFSVLPSLIKKNAPSTKEIFDLWVTWSVSQSQVLKKNRLVNVNLDVAKLEATQRSYGEIMMASDWIAEKDRPYGDTSMIILKPLLTARMESVKRNYQLALQASENADEDYEEPELKTSEIIQV